KADVPFTHPFGGDWEFMLSPDPSYTGLMARANQVLDPEHNAGTDFVAIAKNVGVPIPNGQDDNPALLGVEIEGGLVPDAFKENVKDGDRAVVVGKWIVDCGHALKVEVPDSGDPTFKTEIHPPLVLATARVTEGSIMTGVPTGPPLTRVLVTSRP